MNINKLLIIKRYFKIEFKKKLRLIKLKFYLLKRKWKQEWKFRKKYIIIKYSIIFILLFLSYLSIINRTKIVDKSTHTKEVIFADTTNTLNNFLYQLRYIESTNNYGARRMGNVILKTARGLDTVTAYSQYIGYYQLGNAARIEVKNICPSLKSVSTEEFWNSKFYQHKFMIYWLIYLKELMETEINIYNDKFLGSFYITESGIIAMSHLVGPITVKRWLYSGRYDLYYVYRIVDGNGKKGIDYLQQLGRYNLNLERFYKNGKLNEKFIDSYVKSIMNNETSKEIIIKNVTSEDSYKIIDSVDYLKDSIFF